MASLNLRLLKSPLPWLVAAAAILGLVGLWALATHAEPGSERFEAQSDNDDYFQRPREDVRIDYDNHRVSRRDPAGLHSWSTPLEGNLGGVRPPDLLGDADRVYVSHGDGVTALDYRTGAVLWHSPGPNDRMMLSGELLLATDCGSGDLTEKGGRVLIARAVADGKAVFQAQLPAKDFDPEPIREVAGLFLVQVCDDPGGDGAALLFDQKGRLRHRLDHEVVNGRALGEDRLLLTSREVVRLGPDDKPKWTDPFKAREWIAGGGVVDLPGGDVLAFLYGQISDSGVRVMRVRPDDGTVVWEAFCDPLGVSHSKYRHRAKVAVADGRVNVVSHASGGGFVEGLDLESGRQIKRTKQE